MEKNDEYTNEKAKNTGAWAKATENIAKALAAVVGLAVCLIWNFGKNK